MQPIALPGRPIDMKLMLRAAAAVIVGVLLAGCHTAESGQASGIAVSGSSSSGAGTDPAHTPGSVGGGDCALPTSAVRTSGPADDAEPIISVSGSPRWMGLRDLGLQLVLYSDGTLVRTPARNTEGRDADPEPGLVPLDSTRLDDCLIRELVTELIDLTPPDGEFGSPEITDVGGTTVTFRRPDGTEAEHDAYALGQGQTERLTPEQNAARERLLAVIGLLHTDLPASPMPIEQVQVITEPQTPPVVGLRRGSADAATVTWPLGDQRPDGLTDESGACVVIEGEDARTLAAVVTPKWYGTWAAEVSMRFPDEAEPVRVGVAIPFPGYEC